MKIWLHIFWIINTHIHFSGLVYLLIHVILSCFENAIQKNAIQKLWKVWNTGCFVWIKSFFPCCARLSVIVWIIM